ncbi:MAG TPA: M13 family metallopeptidase [Candidatus Acidoferrales bacterium]|nr:M13 family metallopeptidase [Candidatus Acidoferrales bacterium]
MNKHARAVLLIGVVTLLFCLAMLAQSTSSAAAEETQQGLPSGLDKRFIDESADPCVNFFQYACGNFPKYYPIPNDRSGFGTGTILFEHNQVVLHAMLDKAAAGGAERTANQQKIGDYYGACMDIDIIDQKGLRAFQPELDRIAALKEKSELTPLLAHYQLINVNAFLGLGEQQDFHDASKQIAITDQGGLGLPERDYYFRTGDAAETTRKQYVQHIKNTLNLIGEPESDATADAQSIFQLETAMAKISMDITSRREPKNIYHPTAVSDLQKATPSLDWTRLLSEARFPSLNELNVTNPDYFKGLNTLLETTDMKTIKAYLRWQLMASADQTALPKAMDEERFDFYGRKLRGQPEQQARWKRCVQATDRALGEALGQVYAAQEFPPSSKAATLQMVRDIENAMDQDLNTLDWMSPETKTRAKAKLHAVADKIGYPDHWRDYSRLAVKRDDAYGNAERATIFENLRQIDKIGKPVDRGEWGMTPPTVNAYYNPSMNDINFPAGILQPPLYDPKASDAENYGHIGGIVGHELTHGFDDQGRQFDGKGNLADWWSPDDEKKFVEKADCTVREYGSFVAVDDVHVNGKLTLGENTADNGGLRLAFLAFLADAKRKNIDLTQKQDGYTPIQQFFLGHGQSWCGSTRPEQQRLQVQTDPHSPREFRVNGVVQNMPEFGQAFGCKVGQPMTPQNSCRVW